VRGWQRRDLVDQLIALLVVDRDPGLGLPVFFDRAAMLTYDEVIDVKAADDVLQCLRRGRTYLLLARWGVGTGRIGRLITSRNTVYGPVLVVECPYQVEPSGK
jgi:hypothetical protein